MDWNVWEPEEGSTFFKSSQVREARGRSLSHQPPLTPEAWRRRRARILDAVRRHAGLGPDPAPLDPRIHRTVRRPGYEVRALTYQSRPGMRVTANLYLPDGPGPFPGVLSVHGHWPQGKIADRVQQRGHLLAAAGFAVLAVDAFGAGERGTTPGVYEYHGAGLGGALMDLGEPLLGMQVFDNRRGLDLLASLPGVAADRLGVTGASGGGNQTLWLAALDPRVKAAVPVVSVGTFESYVTRSNCICEVLPDGLTFMEESDALGLAAPNAVLVLNALRDSNPTFAVSAMIRSVRAARRIFALYGAEAKLDYQAFDTPHGYWPEMHRAMLGWFRRWLKGEGDGRPCALPEYRTLPEADCLCFPDKRRPASVVSIAAYYRRRARALAAGHTAGRVPLQASAQRRRLQALLRVPAGADPAPALEIGAAPLAGTESRPGGELRKAMVESEPGVYLPAIVLAPPRAARRAAATLILHPQGKGAFCHSAAVLKAVAGGRLLALADLRGTGETAYDADRGSAPFHDVSRACLWLGRTLLGDWTRDILALAGWLGARVDVLAYGETGLAALCAAALGRRIRSVTAVGLLASYVWDCPAPRASMALHVPGILRWGDVSRMAALAACPVTVLNPATAGGRPCSAAQRRVLQRDLGSLSRRLGLASSRRVTAGADPLE